MSTPRQVSVAMPFDIDLMDKPELLKLVRRYFILDCFDGSLPEMCLFTKPHGHVLVLNLAAPFRQPREMGKVRDELQSHCFIARASTNLRRDSDILLQDPYHRDGLKQYGTGGYLIVGNQPMQAPERVGLRNVFKSPTPFCRWKIDRPQRIAMMVSDAIMQAHVHNPMGRERTPELIHRIDQLIDLYDTTDRVVYFYRPQLL